MKKVMSAKTHTPEYLLHKYWARKPHNIVSYFINELSPEGGVVLDPFCGSGVSVHEAQKIGRTAYGIDLNPSACLISDVLTSPPNAKLFYETVSKILDEIEPAISKTFTEGNKLIKYCIHEIVVECPKCKTIQSLSDAQKKGRDYFCSNCHEKVRFNLENLYGTRISAVLFDNEKTCTHHADILKNQEKQSSMSVFGDSTSEYSFDFCENRRILAYKGMTTKDLFTDRNFSILCNLASRFKEIKDERIRKAAFLLLSASTAQCSRLIACRNNLSTGGPAWSIPGFWVPSIHLETNPLIHLRARLKKVCRGLEKLNNDSSDKFGEVKIMRGDSRYKIDELTKSGVKSDLVFFDPPYGDNVPYIEFSSMWNSFLQEYPDPDCDISVSDRLPKDKAWKKYSDDLMQILKEISDNLKTDGKIVITFNNNDMRAWNALLSALQANNFICEFTTFQIPAVVSSKAQKSLEGSYVSDIYSVYKKGDVGDIKKSLSGISEDLIKSARFRGNIISRSLANRVLMLSWLKNNISASLLDETRGIMRGIFEEHDNDFILKDEFKDDPETNYFKDVAIKEAEKKLSGGPCEWSELYEAIAEKTADYGIPDPYELKEALGEKVIMSGKKCISFVSSEGSGFVQKSLFEL